MGETTRPGPPNVAPPASDDDPGRAVSSRAAWERPVSARTVAFELLQAVLGRRRPFDEALAAASGAAGEPGLDERDRAFARLMAATCLRRLGQIDALIRHCLETPLPPRAAAAQDVLRLGACQLVFLGTAPHAAVDQSVALAEAAGQGRFKGLVNAVLRRLAREGGTLAGAQDAARLNTPDWLWETWSEAYGADRCRAIAEAHLAEPPLDLTARRDPQVWAELLPASLLPTGSLRRPSGGAVSGLQGYDEGGWWVQDAAAALPARLLGEVRGREVVEFCAAPGGKTAQLAAAGARVTAVDRSPTRLRQLEGNLKRLRLEAAAVVADAALWRPPAPVGFVLLDAPCSATGTIRRHPDIARLKRPEDVARLSAVQERLLAAAVEMLAPGGILVYASCSLQPEEGPQQIAKLLAQGAPLEPLPVLPSEAPGLNHAITPDGTLRILPCHWPELGGLDGFYIARLQRM